MDRPISRQDQWMRILKRAWPYALGVIAVGIVLSHFYPHSDFCKRLFSPLAPQFSARWSEYFPGMPQPSDTNGFIPFEYVG